LEEGGAGFAAGAGGGHQDPSTTFSRGAYFIGKAVWGKGWRELLELLDYAQQKREQQEQQDGGDNDADANATTPTPTPTQNEIVDLYGGGEDLDAIEREASARDLRVSFKGPADHSDCSLIGPYRVFLNPSTSDVVATTTAEALAMGKWAVVEDLPCNEFFRQFDNCLIYRTPDEFAAHLERALREDPQPMTPQALRALSWEAATERFLRASEIGPLEWPSEAERRYGALLWRMYKSVTGFRLLRQALGLAPEAVVEGARPEEGDAGEGSEFERVAAIEEADLLFSKGPEWFRSNSGADPGDDDDAEDVMVSAVGSPALVGAA
jgi:digalactosyldiacylglycerol synthase